jgi:hypothetical protein
MNSVDELLRSKLSQHAVPPSPSAWSAIEQQLDAHRKPVVMWRWAAVLLLGALSFVAYQSFRTPPAPVLTNTKPLNNAPTETVKQEPAITTATATTKDRTRKIIKPVPVLAPATTTEAVVALEPLVEDEVVAEIAAEPAPAVAISKPATGIVLTYTLEPITNTAPVAVAAEQPVAEEKTAATLLAKARRAELPIGDFRQMKDDFFALDMHRKTTTKQQ